MCKEHSRKSSQREIKSARRRNDGIKNEEKSKQSTLIHFVSSARVSELVLFRMVSERGSEERRGGRETGKDGDEMCKMRD